MAKGSTTGLLWATLDVQEEPFRYSDPSTLSSEQRTSRSTDLEIFVARYTHPVPHITPTTMSTTTLPQSSLSETEIEASHLRRERMRSLSTRILHPDIFLSILVFLSPTMLPPLMRASRYLHSLVGPILYADLPIPPLNPSAICPHLSPIGSLFLSPGSSFLPSPSDLRAILHDRPSRKRLLLQSARTLRLHAQHVHGALPLVMRDLRLDMRRVHTLHLVGSSAICHHIHPTIDNTCTIYTNLLPKVVVIESTHLALGCIGGLSLTAHEGIDHLVVILRPADFGMYPLIQSEYSLLSSLQRLTIVFTPNTHLDKNGRMVSENWRPSSRSACGGYYWEDKPSFSDLLEHIVGVCDSVCELEVVGAEVLDKEWVEAGTRRRHDAQRETFGGEWMENRLKDAALLRDGAVGSCRTIRAVGLDEWMDSKQGILLDPAPISAGIVGKGAARRVPSV